MKKYILTNVTFRFNNTQQPFFSHASVHLEAGKIYVVQGKNGVGKSTLFSLLQGTNPHDSLLTGTITYDDQSYEIKNNHLPREVSSLVKTVVQDSNKMIVTTMTVKENLQIAQLSRYPLPVPLENHTTFPTIMNDFALDFFTPVDYLSGGQKQILAIIMALQKPTKILLLDEPTAALDDKNTKIVIDFLTTLAQKLDLIILIITHDKEIIHKCGPGQRITIKNNDDQIRTIEQN